MLKNGGGVAVCRALKTCSVQTNLLHLTHGKIASGAHETIALGLLPLTLHMLSLYFQEPFWKHGLMFIGIRDERLLSRKMSQVQPEAVNTTKV